MKWEQVQTAERQGEGYHTLTAGQRRYLVVKRILGWLIAAGACLVFSPVLAAVAVAVKVDSPGPVLFRQKRVGKDKRLFEIYKFRTMRTDTPKNQPTHLLADPEAYITRVGRVLRKTSLDELPQLFNILKGEMYLVGPRPALWNQEDLIAQRDRYGVHQIAPGLTGWAQINGRDELEIPVKAALDGEYLRRVGLAMDVRCLLGTVVAVLRRDGVVEGGTGRIQSRETPRLLLVANVAKEHVCKFHRPTLRALREAGWVADVACHMDAPVEEASCCYPMPWRRNPFHPGTVAGVVKLRRLLRQGAYDVLYCHTPTGALVARLAVVGCKPRPQMVYMAHGFHFYKGAPLRNWLLYYPVERILARQTDVLVTINEEDYRRAQRRHMYRRALVRLPGVGADLERLEAHLTPRSQLRAQLGLEEGDWVLIYVAELIANKNQGKLLELVARLAPAHPGVKLLLVGPDHARGAYQAQARRLGVDSRVVFTGWRSDIGDLLRASDLCVASSKREGFGLNLIEAMACGLPVVAFDNRGHREVVRSGENGFLVPQGDVEEMARCVEGLMGAEYARFSASARAFAQERGQQVVTGEIVDILHQTRLGALPRRTGADK